MTAVAPPTAAGRLRRSFHAPEVRRPPTLDACPWRVPAASRDSTGRGGTVWFEVPFTSAMSDSDLAVLARVLDLSRPMYPKMRPDPNSPGVATA